MSKRALVLYSFKSHKTGYIEMLFSRLLEVAKKSDLQLVRGSLKDLHIIVMNNTLSIKESMSSEMLDAFDAVYFELWYKSQPQALAAARYLSRANIPYFSNELEHILPMTKVGEIAVMSDGTVPVPNTFSSSLKQTLQIFRNAPPIPYPLIVKAEDGYGGKNNFLVHSFEELSKILSKHRDKTFVVQEFIANDFDYRCIVLGGEICFVLKRQRSGDTHLNNTSQGAEGTACDVNELSLKMQADVLRAALLVGRSSFAGVDLLVSNEGKGHYILEVNQTPQIEIGSNIEKKMTAVVTYIKEIAS